MILNAIWTAIISDLQQITIANGYEIGIRNAYQEPVPKDVRRTPCTWPIEFESGVSDLDSLNNRRGEAEHRFALAAAVASSSPYTDLLKFIDAIRNTLERDGSATSLVGVDSGGDYRVTHVDVESWEYDRDTATMNAKYAEAELVILVRSTFVRGST